MKRNSLLFAVVFAFLSIASAQPPSIESFFQNPTLTGFRISPDGKNLAGLAPYDGALNLYVFNLETRQPRVLTGQKLDVTEFYWVNNNRLFYSINQGASSADANRSAGAIFGVDVDGDNHKPVLKSMYERRFTPGEKHRGFIRVVNILDHDEDNVLVENSSRRSNYPDIFKMNVRSGALQKVANNPGYIVNYFYDIDGTVLGGFSKENVDDLNGGSIVWKDRDTGKFETVLNIESIFDAPEFVGLSSDRKKVIVSKKTEDGFMKLYAISFDGKYREELLYEDDEYDLSGITRLYSLKTKGIIGIRYDREKPVNKFFNNTYESLYKMINEAIPDGSNYVYDFDDAGKKLLIRSISDRKSPEYYLLDLSKGELELLGKMFPNLDKLYLPEQRPISFEARDGHKVHGYIYLPEGYQQGTPVPMIVNPHGGPWGRDTWGIRWWYDIEPIYFTSRGFAVLKVNFRASTGYGKQHENAADKNWDVAMEDIWDGVSWAIDQGYADQDRIGVVGASFGGTATMLSMVHQPDMFQFGINFFGVVDVPEQIKTYYEWDRDVAGDYWKMRVGDPKNPEDKEKLHRWSAINYVENIRAPLFLYHGLIDRNVDIEQTRMLERRLKGAGLKKDRDFVVIYNSDEAHGSYDPEERIKLYTEVEKFIRPFAPALNE